MRGSSKNSDAARGAQHRIKEHYPSFWTHTHLPWKRVCGGVDRGRAGGGRLAVAGGVRDCRWRCFTHSPRPGQGAVARTAAAIGRQPFPFIWAPRVGRRRSFRVNLTLSPPAVACHRLRKNRSSGSHHSPHPRGCESHGTKAWRKIQKWREATLFRSFGSNYVAVTSALAPRALVWWQVWDSPVCGRRKPSVRLCLCNSSALSLVRPCLQRAWLSKPSGYP